MNSDGYAAQLKAHLIAKGYAHTYEVDCSGTFSSVVKLAFYSLSLVVTYDWPLHQLDIRNPFLHGDL